jgi:hypothetical protein
VIDFSSRISIALPLFWFLIWFCSPVYVTQQRRNAAGVGLVFEADLDTTEHSSLWVLQVRYAFEKLFSITVLALIFV